MFPLLPQRSHEELARPVRHLGMVTEVRGRGDVHGHLHDATEPVDIVVDGSEGLQMEWSVPADIDFSTCGDGFFDSWTAAAGSWNGGRYQQGPRQVDRLWILDVGGERLVVDAMYMPSTDAKDRKALWQVMESIRFEA